MTCRSADPTLLYPIPVRLISHGSVPEGVSYIFIWAITGEMLVSLLTPSDQAGTRQERSWEPWLRIRCTKIAEIHGVGCAIPYTFLLLNSIRVMVLNSCRIVTLNTKYLPFSVSNDAFDHYTYGIKE